MIKFALPVILSKEKEIELFLDTKRELEREHDNINIGAFAIQFPFTLIESNFEKQVRNYQSYNKQGLEIYHVQAPIEQENCILQKGPLLEKTIELCSSFNEDFLINYHVGLVLTTQNEVSNYQNKKLDYFSLAIKNFRELNDKAKTYGLKLCLENEPLCFMQPTRGKQGIIEANLFPYYEFAKLNETSSSSGLNLCFDTGHYAASRLAEKYLAGTSSEQLILEMIGCKSWGGVNRLIGSWNDWVNHASIYHISNVTGIGCHLKDEDAKKWGEDGVIQGYLAMNKLKQLIKNDKLLNLEFEVNLGNPELFYERHKQFINEIL